MKTSPSKSARRRVGRDRGSRPRPSRVSQNVSEFRVEEFAKCGTVTGGSRPGEPARVESGSNTRPRDEGREAYQVDVGYLRETIASAMGRG